MVTGDSLGMHMAIALEKHVVAFFGPTSAPRSTSMVAASSSSRPAVSPCWSPRCSEPVPCSARITDRDRGCIRECLQGGLGRFGVQLAKSDGSISSAFGSMTSTFSPSFSVAPLPGPRPRLAGLRWGPRPRWLGVNVGGLERSALRRPRLGFLFSLLFRLLLWASSCLGGRVSSPGVQRVEHRLSPLEFIRSQDLRRHHSLDTDVLDAVAG